MVAAQLVNAVPHTDAKFYAATQTMDEARHVEVFARYIEKLDEVRPIAPALKRILDATLTTDDWMKKLVGMQIVVEGLALYSFKEMRSLTRNRCSRICSPTWHATSRATMPTASNTSSGACPVSAIRNASSSRTSPSKRRAR
jgi:hypothetical protein